MSTPPADIGLVELDDWESEQRWEWLPPRRRRRQRVMLLLDPDDDKEITAALLAAGDPAGGIVTVHPTPGMSSSAALAHDILVALGRSLHRLADQRVVGDRPAWLAVKSWITADDIRRVIVLRAHRLSPQRWAELIELWRATGVQLVLVCHATTERDAVRRLPEGITPRRIERVTQVTRRPRGRRPARGEPVALQSLPPVPDTDVVSFRAEAYRRMNPAEFARVDAVYRHGMTAACRWLAAAPGPVSTAGEHGVPQLFPRGMRGSTLTEAAEVIEQRYSESELRALVAGLMCGGSRYEARTLPQQFEDTAGVHRFLTNLVADAPTPRHAVTLLRGAQAGALLHGVLLEMPADLIDSCGPGLSGVPITAGLADEIRARVANPIHAAAVVCALFTAFEPDELLRITVGAVSQTGAVLRWNTATRHETPDWCVLTVPVQARPFLLAARTYAELRGTASDKPLFKGTGALSGTQISAIALGAGMSLPAPDPVAGRWWRTVRAWYVGQPLHHEDR